MNVSKFRQLRALKIVFSTQKKLIIIIWTTFHLLPSDYLSFWNKTGANDFNRWWVLSEKETMKSVESRAQHKKIYVNIIESCSLLCFMQRIFIEGKKLMTIKKMLFLLCNNLRFFLAWISVQTVLQTIFFVCWFCAVYNECERDWVISAAQKFIASNLVYISLCVSIV